MDTVDTFSVIAIVIIVPVRLLYVLYVNVCFRNISVRNCIAVVFVVDLACVFPYEGSCRKRL